MICRPAPTKYPRKCSICKHICLSSQTCTCLHRLDKFCQLQSVLLYIFQLKKLNLVKKKKFSYSFPSRQIATSWSFLMCLNVYKLTGSFTIRPGIIKSAPFSNLRKTSLWVKKGLASIRGNLHRK